MSLDYDDLEAVRRRLEEAQVYVASLPSDCDAHQRAARAVAILDRCLNEADLCPAPACRYVGATASFAARG